MFLEYTNDSRNQEENDKYQAMLKTMQDEGRVNTEESLSKDIDWLESCYKLYKLNEGKEFNGDPKEATKYGIEQMRQFNYSMGLGMMPDVAKIHGADPETQMAFAYMMDAYDKKEPTMEGFAKAVAYSVLDPVNIVGLGGGFIAKKLTENAAKTAFKETLYKGLRTYLGNNAALGATAGATWTMADETARQSIMQDAELQQGYNVGKIGAMGAIGAGAGYGITKGIEVAGKAIGKGIDYINKQGEEAMAQVAGGGTPPKMIALHDQAQLDDFLTRIDSIDRAKIDDITKRYTVKPSKPSNLFRGVEAEGYERKGGGASEGYGLYTTANKSLAKDYGKVVDMNPNTDIPSNPLAFKDYNDFEVWQQQLMYNTLGFKRKSEFGNVSLNEIIHAIYPDNDGIQIGKGNSSFFVKYPKFDDLKEENIK